MQYLEKTIESSEINSPLVSIIMATYNGSGYVTQQIESILSQEYAAFELIIVDDNSTDNTVEIILELAKEDSRIALHANDRNMGVVRSFEKGIILSTGELIALSDQDDIWLPNHLNVLIESIGQKSLAHTDSFMMYGNYKSNRLFSSYFSWVYRLNDVEKVTYLTQANYVRGASCLFTKSLKQYILPFPQNIPMHDHWIAFCAASFNGIHDTELPTTYYRRHDSTVTTEKRLDLKKILNWEPQVFAMCVQEAVQSDHPVKSLISCEHKEIIGKIVTKDIFLIKYILSNYRIVYGKRRLLHIFFLLLRFTFWYVRKNLILKN